MTLSCRAQAFSVDNLLRPSPTSFTASASPLSTSSSPVTPTNDLPSTFQLEKLLFTSRKRANNNDVTRSSDWSNCDDLPTSLRFVQSFPNTNVKHDSSIHSHHISHDTFTFKRQTQTDLKDTIKPFHGESKYSRSENVDNPVNELYRFPFPSSSKSTEAHSPLDVSRPSKKLRLSTNPGLSNSCFCHGDVIFCHHPGIVSIADANGSDNSIIAELCHADLWTSFHRLGTEMIITKTGRRMFPALKVRITGLYPDKQYVVRLEFVQPDTRKYRYIYHSSRWMASGTGDALTTTQSHRAPEGPVSGQAICSQIVSFERLKLTNTDPCKTGQVSLVSMQKFQPQIVIQEVSSITGNDASENEHYVIMFPQTSFMAVTAYQNQQITTLKIASNPFAKGFRESGKARIPYESFMTAIPNFLSCDTALNYMPGIVRSSAWTRAQLFPPDYNFSVDKGCQDGHSGGDQCKVSPEKIVKMEAETSAESGCHSDLTATSTPFPSNPTLHAALQKPLRIPLPQRHIHPNGFQLYDQHQRHFQENLLAPTTPGTLHSLLQFSPYLSEQHRIMTTPLEDIAPRGDGSQNAQLQTTIKPPPAHMPLTTTALSQLNHQRTISEIATDMSESYRFNHMKKLMLTNNSHDFLNRGFGNRDVRLINDSHSLKKASHSHSEQRCANGRSLSSTHNASSAFNVMLPPRCMTEPSKMATDEICRRVGCRYQATPSNVS